MPRIRLVHVPRAVRHAQTLAPTSRIAGAMYENEEGEWVPVPRPLPLESVVRSALLNALAYTNGNQTQAGALLGLTPRTMGYTLRQYDIPRAQQDGK